MAIAQCKSQAALDNLRARDRAKKARKVARKRADRAAAALTQPASKTSATYRRVKFGLAPERTKTELRAELAAALMNTGAMA